MWPCSGPEGRISWPRPGGISWADGEAAWSAPWPVFTLREEMERELNAIVDAGGEVVDVIVEHPVYGQLTGLLGVRSRYDVAEFVRRGGGARSPSALSIDRAESTCTRSAAPDEKNVPQSEENHWKLRTFFFA